jgi:signal peptidase II
MKSRRCLLYSLLFGLSIVLDRITKSLAVYYLVHNDMKPLSFLHFSLVWNTGISWGMFNNMHSTYTRLLTIVILIIIATFFMFTVQQYKRGKIVLGEVFVLAGACSNIIDRLWYGAVVDFIHVVWPLSCPVFNIADALIVVGVGIIMLSQMWDYEYS